MLPEEKPRYLMGVGTPENLLECIALGIDMFDCVLPTRNGRNGMLFTSAGIINIRNEKWKDDFSPIDPGIEGYASNTYSKAYLRHLVISKEILGAQIASLHNLTYYSWMIGQARKHINEGTFHEWKESVVREITRRL
jgi:queuine tRNA-ribosyltransferase